MKENEQVILCEGCDSKWIIDVSRAKIIVALVGCPLCMNPKHDEQPEV